MAWSGFYIGGHLGDAGGQSDWTATGPGGAQPDGSIGFGHAFDASKGTGSYFAGLQTGYNHQLPSGIVLGLQADISFPNTVKGTRTFASPPAGQAAYEEQVLYSGTARGRLGFLHHNWLFYGTGGYAWSWDESRRTQITGVPAGGTALPGSIEPVHTFRSGWVAGAGVEVPVAANWTASLEYLYTGFGSQVAAFTSGAQRFDADLALQSVRLGLNYQFGAAPSTDQPVPPKADSWSVHAQTTYVHQYTPRFTSPYVGPNSFLPGQGRETWDVTFYVGTRLWQGAELWVNAEIDQGFGLSGTLGIAGFVSGEAYKLGAADPYTRLPRTFLRQTINLGGESEKVEAAANQLAGRQSANRVVLTVGKFGVTDIFDTNRYAHDPRSDFLNWALVDTATFDYAADAWGYTYGAAVEWYQGRWAFRAGLFDLPRVPNSTQLDPDFSQFQWIGEIEHRHQLWGQPGKLAVTGFLTRSRMGRFDDAVALANLTGQPADIAAVRQFRSRAGISLNAEQQLAPDIGMFVRAGLAQGNAEPFAFTDVDRTVAAGVVVTGKRWGRPDDTVGIAGVINGISSAHIAYFDAGGLGILLGDGRLPNPGTEKILEAYYSFPLWASWRATLDYQFIDNPGYNEDRGPVSVFGTRLRKQF
jgi:high affinity Mn2+ porin